MSHEWIHIQFLLIFYHCIRALGFTPLDILAFIATSCATYQSFFMLCFWYLFWFRKQSSFHILFPAFIAVFISIFVFFSFVFDRTMFETANTNNLTPSTNLIQSKRLVTLENIRASYRLGKNFLKWSWFTRTYLKGKRHLVHLTELGPAKDDIAFRVWDEEDSMIMS